MAMDIKLQQRITQQLVMTPQLQQAIKLLQLSRLELASLVQNEMMENPILEDLNDGAQEVETESTESHKEVPEFTEQAVRAEVDTPPPTTESAQADDKSPDMDWNEYFENYSSSRSTPSQSGGNSSEELPSLEATLSTKTSLFDHMIWQIQLSTLNKYEVEIATRIVGNLNENGYLLDANLEQFLEKEEGNDSDFGIEDVEEVLKVIQEFDPLGVAARSLEECLLIQARHYGHIDEEMEQILTHHIPNLERKNYQAIAKDLKMPLEDIIEYAKLISTYNPRPGREYSTDDTHYITPDVYIYKIGEKYFVVSNDDGMPKLKISGYYRQALSKEGKGNTKDYIQEKLRSAQWLIRSIQQRQRTIIKVTESIIKFQREFFDKGIAYLKPLILRDVAEDIGMHESTVSRVTTNKYVHTPQGIFELKYFFNSGINRIAGDEIASESVKTKIKYLISQENPKKPLSDQKLVNALKKFDIDVARRTVAKYRDMLGILPSSRRKKLF